MGRGREECTVQQNSINENNCYKYLLRLIFYNIFFKLNAARNSFECKEGAYCRGQDGLRQDLVHQYPSWPLRMLYQSLPIRINFWSLATPELQNFCKKRDIRLRFGKIPSVSGSLVRRTFVCHRYNGTGLIGVLLSRSLKNWHSSGWESCRDCRNCLPAGSLAGKINPRKRPIIFETISSVPKNPKKTQKHANLPGDCFLGYDLEQ